MVFVLKIDCFAGGPFSPFDAIKGEPSFMLSRGLFGKFIRATSFNDKANTFFNKIFIFFN